VETILPSLPVAAQFQRVEESVPEVPAKVVATSYEEAPVTRKPFEVPEEEF